MSNDRLTEIREAEKQSHIEIYSSTELFTEGSWLQKPVKTVLDIIPLISEKKDLRVLDLGCGIGRNCIPIAKAFSDLNCRIDCIDILDLAIEKLYQNAEYHLRYPPLFDGISVSRQDAFAYRLRISSVYINFS